MEILAHDAQEIVNELSKLIGLKINIVGSNAVIIANSDPKRVGDFHEVTHQIIRNNLNELVAFSDEQYKGTYAGTNLPIVINDKIVGVIGITGPYKVAVTYGKVIKKMAEIMLQSRLKENQLIHEQQAFERFQTAWVCSSQTVINDAFISRGKSFGIDITYPRRIAVVSGIDGVDDKIVDIIRSILSTQPNSDYAFMTSHLIIILMMNRSDEEVKVLFQHISDKTVECGIKLYMGVDNGFRSIVNIHKQYAEAKAALNAACRLQANKLIFYKDKDLNLELVLDEISFDLKQKYIRKIFGNCPILEIERDLKTVNILYEEDGSIKRASERLIVHPNTLQYQLKRIEVKTGYDPRKPRYAAIFSIASVFMTELGHRLPDYEK
jgi:carbohydrate diacid regulator